MHSTVRIQLEYMDNVSWAGLLDFNKTSNKKLRKDICVLICAYKALFSNKARFLYGLSQKNDKFSHIVWRLFHFFLQFPQWTLANRKIEIFYLNNYSCIWKRIDIAQSFLHTKGTTLACISEKGRIKKKWNTFNNVSTHFVIKIAARCVCVCVDT